MYQIDDMLTEIMIQQQNAAREARMERCRLVQAAFGQQRARFYQPALRSLGKRLVIWGTQLQESQREHCGSGDIRLARYNQ